MMRWTGAKPLVAALQGHGIVLVRHTVKTHLQRIYAKTGTRRQAEFVELLIGHTL